MMAGWVVYTLLTSLLLVIPGFAMEQIARACRAPTRVVWLGVLVASFVLSAASLRRESTLEPMRAQLSPAGTVSLDGVRSESSEVGAVRANATMARARTADRKPRNELATRLRELTTLRFDPSRWQRYDDVVAITCASLAIAGLSLLFASYVRLRRRCSVLDQRKIDGVPVLVSRQLGPAVFGVVRPRVVIPRWLLSLPDAERTAVLLHEAQHSAARDPMLVLLGAIVVALQPWNALLWIAFARLRLAVEVDCDARVLRRCQRDARWYGRLLVNVCEHELASSHAGRLPLIALVDSTSHLERRVRRMNNRQPRVRSLSTMSAFVLAVLCVGVACSVRLLSAREAVAETSLEASRLMERASSDSEAVMAPSETVAVRAVFTPRWRAALPAVVNSQRAQVPSTLSVVTPARRTREPLADAATAEASGQSFTPETLFVRASNPKWPMRVRIISATGDNERPVLVTDTLGRQLPSADTLTVDGPVQLILPDTKLQVVIESLGGDMAITTSPITAPNGRGRWVNTLLGRKLAFSRAAGEDWGKLRVEGVGYGSSQRVP